MAQDGLLGTGIRIASATGSPHTWRKYELILDATPPQLSADKIDRTVHGTNFFKQSMSGMYNVSDGMIKFLRDPDPATSPNQNGLWAYQSAQTLLWWRFEIPANSIFTLFTAYMFQARVGDFKESTPITGRQELDVTLVFGGTSLSKTEPAASVIG